MLGGGDGWWWGFKFEVIIVIGSVDGGLVARAFQAIIKEGQGILAIHLISLTNKRAGRGRQCFKCAWLVEIYLIWYRVWILIIRKAEKVWWVKKEKDGGNGKVEVRTINPAQCGRIQAERAFPINAQCNSEK
jgi:hypothetical protein